MTEPVHNGESQQQLPLALVRGQPFFDLPQDLYIPPDALEVILESFEGPLDLLLYLIRRQNLDIQDSGIYQVEVSSNGCSSLSGELEVILGQMPSPLLNLILPDTYCAGTDEAIIDAEGSGNLFYTIMEAGSTAADTFNNVYAITASGTYYIEAFTEYCSMAIEPPLEFFFHEPVVPALRVEGNILTSSPAATYQWYQDGDVIPGATGQSFTAQESGLYAVATTDGNGCSARSETILLDVSSNVNFLTKKGIRLYPNPAGAYLFLEANTEPQAYRILAVSGQDLTDWRQWKPGQPTIDTEALPVGAYLVQLLFEDGMGSLRIIKQ